MAAGRSSPQCELPRKVGHLKGRAGDPTGHYTQYLQGYISYVVLKPAGRNSIYCSDKLTDLKRQLSIA